MYCHPFLSCGVVIQSSVHPEFNQPQGRWLSGLSLVPSLESCTEVADGHRKCQTRIEPPQARLGRVLLLLLDVFWKEVGWRRGTFTATSFSLRNCCCCVREVRAVCKPCFHGWCGDEREDIILYSCPLGPCTGHRGRSSHVLQLTALLVLTCLRCTCFPGRLGAARLGAGGSTGGADRSALQGWSLC